MDNMNSYTSGAGYAGRTLSIPRMSLPPNAVGSRQGLQTFDRAVRAVPSFDIPFQRGDLTHSNGNGRAPTARSYQRFAAHPLPHIPLERGDISHATGNRRAPTAWLYQPFAARPLPHIPLERGDLTLTNGNHRAVTAPSHQPQVARPLQSNDRSRGILPGISRGLTVPAPSQPYERRTRWTKLRDPSLEQKYGSKTIALDVSFIYSSMMHHIAS